MKRKLRFAPQAHNLSCWLGYGLSRNIQGLSIGIVILASMSLFLTHVGLYGFDWFYCGYLFWKLLFVFCCAVAIFEKGKNSPVLNDEAAAMLWILQPTWKLDFRHQNSFFLLLPFSMKQNIQFCEMILDYNSTKPQRIPTINKFLTL